jgi:hypothetical protein
MSSQFGEPSRLRSLGGARLGGVGRSLNRPGSMSTPRNDGTTKAAKVATTSTTRASSTKGPLFRDSGGYSRPKGMVWGHGFQVINPTFGRAE